MRNLDNEVDAEICEIKNCSITDIENFIRTEINPYFSIPIEDKLTEKSLTDYAKKLVLYSDGMVFVKNRKIIGIIAGYINRRYIPDEVYISLYGVSKLMRGKGYGKSLMQKFIEQVPSGLIVWANCDEKNLDAQKVYEKLGFHITNSENGRLTLKRMVD